MLIDADRPDARDPHAAPVAVVARPLGVQTNNFAEYTAVALALRRALELGADEVELVLDSKLVVEQLGGRWKVRHPAIRPLVDEAQALLARFRRWSIRHEPRAANFAADALANLALDDAAAAAAAERSMASKQSTESSGLVNNESRDFGASWAALPPAVRSCLRHAYSALLAGGLGCGAALTDATGEIVAEGRNHAYDPPGGRDVLQGSPIAHAEMNVLAGVRTELDLSGSTLWTTQEPCSMCTAAADFTGVTTIRYVAPDPWALATRRSRAGKGIAPEGVGGRLKVAALGVDTWVIAANLIFMLSIGRSRGPDHPTITRNAELEPETTSLALSLIADDLPPAVEPFLERGWRSIEMAAQQRRSRPA